MEELLEILKDPEVLGEVHNIIETYKAPVYSIIGELLGIYRDYINNDEHYLLDAKNQMKQYEAYYNAGFSEDQAMMLLLNKNINLIEQMNKFSTKYKSRN